jgi:hypothetical protein
VHKCSHSLTFSLLCWGLNPGSYICKIGKQSLSYIPSRLYLNISIVNLDYCSVLVFCCFDKFLRKTI